MFVTLKETYDLSTTKDKMGIIAIRTPSLSAVNKKWPGFVRNFKFVRAVSCNVRVACASVMPADPLQIGTVAGKVAPQDLFNPILYKTVSNESWNGIVNRIYGPIGTGGFTDSLSEVAHVAVDAFSGVDGAVSTNSYYALLSEPGWRKAAPQAGLSMSNIRPLVWSVLNTIGAPVQASPTSAPQGTAIGVGQSGTTFSAGNNNFYLKGNAQAMPRVPTVVSATDVMDTGGSYNGISVVLNDIPRCYCACLIMPPSALQVLYYRLVVSWNVEFSEPRSDAELGMLQTTNELGRWAHYPASVPASKLTEVSDTSVEADSDHSVEADGLDMNLVMDV